MIDEKIRVRVKLGANEVEFEGSASALQQAIEIIPSMLRSIPTTGEASTRPSGATSSPQPPSPLGQIQGGEGQAVSPLPEIQVGKDDSLTDVITKIFSQPWGKQPRKLSQVREVLESYGLIYPKQSVAVSLLRLAQAGKLRRFKGEVGEFVYLASAALSGESSIVGKPLLDAQALTEGQMGLQQGTQIT